MPLPLPRVVLTRSWFDEKQTLGSITTPKGAELFICKTLELPWKRNESNISCIPNGEYECRWSRSRRLSEHAGQDVFTYLILNVPDRSGIRIHSANYFTQLLGCIALGDAHKDINADGELDVIHSGQTVKAFNDLMKREPFKIIIKDLT